LVKVNAIHWLLFFIPSAEICHIHVTPWWGRTRSRGGRGTNQLRQYQALPSSSASRNALQGFSLKALRHLVLDEADKLLDMGL